MRPVRPTAVHKTDRLAELVCSNSFRGDKLDNAVGLLKEEMRRLGSLVLRAADEHRVPAGAALAVDRDRFSQAITDAIQSHPLITVVRDEVPRIPQDPAMYPLIIATGPLTSDTLSRDIAALVGAEHLYFYDAISPIVLAETIDMSKVFRASRWGRSLRGGPSAWIDQGPIARREGRRRLRRRRRGRRLSELPDDRRRVRAVLRRAGCRGVGDRARLRQGEVLRGLSADRGDGASRPRHAALRTDEAGRPRRSADRAHAVCRRCSCGRTTSPATTSAWSASRRS